MEPKDFADRHLQPYTIKGDEIIPEYCPYCKGGIHHDKRTAALNIEKRVFVCKRGTCGKTVTFTQLCKDFGEQANPINKDTFSNGYSAPAPKQYKKPEVKVAQPGKQVSDYLALRKISESTMALYGVGDDGNGNIMFPFTEDGEIVFIKYRPAHKLKDGERKAWREKDGKPILFGMDTCISEFPLCIFEGEIDAMSGRESGIPNSVSVPSGCEDMTWIDLCWDWMKQFKSIYLYGDNDEGGQRMIETLSKRLSDWRIFRVAHECKDANELLWRKGKGAVRKAYDNAMEIPAFGLINLANIKPLDVAHIPRTLSGVKDFDREIGGFLDGELSIWTGKRGEGKSTFLGQLLIEAVDQDRIVCAYSGELRADRFQYWINLQAAGKQCIGSYRDDAADRDIYYVDPSILSKIKEWYSGKFWLYDNRIAGANEIENILKAFETAAKRYGCKIFMVDNLMTCRYSTVNDQNYYRMQSGLVGDLVSFAKTLDVHVHLVAHPRKESGELENDSISGSGDITNRADNVFSLCKLSETEKAKYGGADVILQILKNRNEGRKAKIGMNYDPVSRRLYMPSIGNIKMYGWQKTDDEFYDMGEGEF